MSTTILATSSTVANLLHQRGRPVPLDELRAQPSSIAWPDLLDHPPQEVLHSLRPRRARQHRVDGHAGAGGQSREPRETASWAVLVTP